MTDFLDTAIPEAIADTDATIEVDTAAIVHERYLELRSVIDELRAKLPRGCRLVTATDLEDCRTCEGTRVGQHWTLAGYSEVPCPACRPSAESDATNGVDDRLPGWQERGSR